MHCVFVVPSLLIYCTYRTNCMATQEHCCLKLVNGFAVSRQTSLVVVVLHSQNLHNAGEGLAAPIFKLVWRKKNSLRQMSCGIKIPEKKKVTASGSFTLGS